MFDYPNSCGLERIVKRFLFWPKRLQGHWKWLECSWIHQRSQKIKDCPTARYEWIDISWANRKEDKNVLCGWHQGHGH